MRILIVEDDKRIADFLQRALKPEGHMPVCAGDGHEALDLISGADFDLILLDLMLPGLSGLEVCQALRMRRIDLPIIMLTALDTAEDVVRGLRMGADDYITKPSIWTSCSPASTQLRAEPGEAWTRQRY